MFKKLTLTIFSISGLWTSPVSSISETIYCNRPFFPLHSINLLFSPLSSCTFIWETAGWWSEVKPCAVRHNCEFLWVHAHTGSQSPSPVVSHLVSATYTSARVHSAVSEKHKHLSPREISSLIHTLRQMLMEAHLVKQPRHYHPSHFQTWPLAICWGRLHLFIIIRSIIVCIQIYKTMLKAVMTQKCRV